MTAALWGLLCVVAWLAIVYVLVRFLALDRDHAPSSAPRDGEDLWPHTQPPDEGLEQLRRGGAL